LVMFRKILIPVDLNAPEANEVAIRRILHFSKDFNADLRLVYAQLPNLIALSDYGLVIPGIACDARRRLRFRN
jgi:hypothetical protein